MFRHFVAATAVALMTTGAFAQDTAVEEIVEENRPANEGSADMNEFDRVRADYDARFVDYDARFADYERRIGELEAFIQSNRPADEGGTTGQ